MARKYLGSITYYFPYLKKKNKSVILFYIFFQSKIISLKYNKWESIQLKLSELWSINTSK